MTLVNRVELSFIQKHIHTLHVLVQILTQSYVQHYHQHCIITIRPITKLLLLRSVPNIIIMALSALDYLILVIQTVHHLIGTISIIGLLEHVYQVKVPLVLIVMIPVVVINMLDQLQKHSLLVEGRK